MCENDFKWYDVLFFILMILFVLGFCIACYLMAKMMIATDTAIEMGLV